VALTQQHVWLKRISPRFDRKFLKCRVNNPEALGPLYSLTIMGFAEWDVITDRLYQNLLPHRPPIRSSTTQSPQMSVKKHEQSLMPLLSAIGLAVMYACKAVMVDRRSSPIRLRGNEVLLSALLRSMVTPLQPHHSQAVLSNLHIRILRGIFIHSVKRPG
jgi:hypothetical protein